MYCTQAKQCHMQNHLIKINKKGIIIDMYFLCIILLVCLAWSILIIFLI